MHKKIKEFSLLAGGSHYPSINPDRQQAFADIIVEECMKLAEQEAERFYNMDERDLASAMLNYRELLKQHFEIKERSDLNNKSLEASQKRNEA